MTFFERRKQSHSYLGKLVTIGVDRPIGYVHKKPKYDLVYPINYGYIPDVLGGDGEELDVYLLGVDSPVKSYTGRIVGIVYRRNDVEDKLIMAPIDCMPDKEKIERAIHFQEMYYDTWVETWHEANNG